MEVFEVARALGRPAWEVITVLNGMGILVTSHAGVVDASTALKVCAHYAREGDFRPRTVLYLDVYNLFWVAKRYYGRPPDFSRIIELLAGSPLPWTAKAFMPNDGRGDGLARALDRMGYRVLAKAGRRVAPGRLKADFDVEIAVEAMKDFYQYRPEAVYLVSGDGDFVHLVERLRAGGCRVTVAAFPEGFSRELRAAADRWVELGADFLWKPPTRAWDPVRGRVRLSVWLAPGLASEASHGLAGR